MDMYLYGIQYDPTGEVMYSSSDEAKVRQVYDTICGGEDSTGNFSLVAFGRLDTYPIADRVAGPALGFMFGHE